MPNMYQESFFYKNRKTLVIILVFALLGVGWNYWTKPKDGKDNQAKYHIQDTKLIQEISVIPKMPEDYVEFASVVIGEMVPSLEELRRKYSSAKANPFEEFQKMKLELEKIEISSDTLEKQRQDIFADFQDVFELLNRFSWEQTEQNRQLFAMSLQKIDSYPGILAYIGEDYTKEPVDNNGRIVIDFDTLPSPNATEEYDVIAIANTGTPIQNAIFCITLENDQGESAEVYAFTRQIENQWLYFPCPQGLSFDGNSRILNHTVKDVSRVRVEMFSCEFSTIINYSYDTEERGKDQEVAY